MADPFRHVDPGVHPGLPHVAPVVVSVCRCEARDLEEWLEKDWRTADYVRQNPRNDDNQILWGTGAPSDLESQAGFRLLREQVPSFQFNAIRMSSPPVRRSRTSGKV